MFSMAIGYSGFSGLGRVEEMISSIKFGHLDHPLMDPSLRVAVMIDPFGYWPDDRSERSEEQIEIGWVNRAVERIFEIREQTKGTPHELVFILVQHSKAWKLIHPMLDQHVSDRSHYFAIHADLADDDLKRQIRAVWNHVQSDFLRAARLRSVA
jgi:hypothetical protein